MLAEVMLVLKGWMDDSRSVRVDVTSSDLHIVATCKIYKIVNEHIAFHIASSDYFEFTLEDCRASFGDAKDETKEMPIGRTAESAVIAKRNNFKALIVLLKD